MSRLTKTILILGLFILAAGAFLFSIKSPTQSESIRSATDNMRTVYVAVLNAHLDGALKEEEFDNPNLLARLIDQGTLDEKTALFIKSSDMKYFPSAERASNGGILLEAKIHNGRKKIQMNKSGDIVVFNIPDKAK